MAIIRNNKTYGVETIIEGSAPVLQSLSVTENGTYTPDEGVDGYNSVTVNVEPELQNKTITNNGTYTADSGYDGLGTVTVNVNSGSDINYFYLQHNSTSTSDLTATLKKASSSAPDVYLWSSYDKINWTYLGGTTTDGIKITVPREYNGVSKPKVYLRGMANRGTGYNGTNYYNKFVFSGWIKIGGDLTTLVDGYGNIEDLNIGFSGIRFYDLFSNCTYLGSAKDLILPSTTLTDYCYYGMFSGCSTINIAPVLPATTLARYCYSNMFNGCTSLNKVTSYATDISASYCLSGWLYNVASTGDFYNYGGASYSSGTNGIPSGWTEHTS